MGLVAVDKLKRVKETATKTIIGVCWSSQLS